MRQYRVAALAWIGFLLCGSVAAIIHFAPHLYIQAYSLFTPEIAPDLQPLILGAVAAQGASIILLWLRVPGVLLLAWASGIVMLPFGLLFIEGCNMTRQRSRYAAFEPAPPTGEFGLLYANASPENNPHIGLGVMLTGLLFYMLGVMSVIGTFLIVVGIILAIRSKRMRTRPVLGLYDLYFVLTPNILAESFAVPYRQVRGYLLKNKRIFLVVADAAGQERELVVPLSKIDPEDREDAVSTFASRLALGTQLFSNNEYYS